MLRRLVAYLIVLALVFAGYQRGGLYVPVLPGETEENEEQKQQQSEEESAEGLRLKVEASSARHHRTPLVGPSAIAADHPLIVAILPPARVHPTLLVRRQTRLQC